MIAKGVQIALCDQLVPDLLVTAAIRFPDSIAVVAGDQYISYRDLHAKVHTLASTLLTQGVVSGDRVLVLGDNTLETLIGFWATLTAGATVVMVSPLARAERIAYLLRDTGASALITHALHAAAFIEPAAAAEQLRTVIITGNLPYEMLERLPRALLLSDIGPQTDCAQILPRLTDPGALAAIIYTSGSTGMPKGVMHSHRTICAALTAVNQYLGLEQKDILLGALPLAFGYGLLQVLSSTALGARLVLERGFTFPTHILGRIATERVTCVAAVPSVFSLLGSTQAAANVASVRVVTNAAAALNPRQLAVARRVFPQARFFSMYGQTECFRATYLEPDQISERPESMGRPIPNCTTWLEDEAGTRLEPGQVGQLVIRGPHVMLGYWQRPAETAGKLRTGTPGNERTLLTGDLARFDDEGYLYFVARTDDVIKSRGEKVSPREVEDVVSQIPGVQEVAVIGVADELLGEAIKAFVVTEPGTELSAREIQRACQMHLESYMVPRHVEFIAQLPRTLNGKIAKQELK